ncbi:hypothetical protein HVTV-2_gp63 [Haloarcula virus HVTV-2]|uniref:Uncharacterized protein n=1 Tax=Haloarcula vallismortis tailed virus 1 TaxID=1262528 RepID=L7TJ65_9CAUD|nr:hypothetical protein HVTV1_64 [Haloarcula vallismortis tailed virus 1]AGC34433.1 hypothetical protein HVTV1_64 [Haloarcula vallismortis tailed virus 1]UBF22870.1 hypothetical protein HVTV-2_gp63 [Haloarcula virus HVTV-2]
MDRETHRVLEPHRYYHRRQTKPTRTQQMSTDDMLTPGDVQNDEDPKRLDLESVDDDYEEWVVCDPVDRWEKNGMTCVVEEKKWYRKAADDEDAEEELMTESYIGVVEGPESIADATAERLNDVLEVDQPNGLVKRGRYVGFDTLHLQLVDGEEPDLADIRDEVEWVCEQLVMHG